MAACGGGDSGPDWGTLEIAPATDVLIGIAGAEGANLTARTQILSGLDLAVSDTFEFRGHRIATVRVDGSCSDAARELANTEGVIAVVLVSCGNDLADALSTLSDARVTTLLVSDTVPLPVAEAPALRVGWSDAAAAPAQGRFVARLLGVESVTVVRSPSAVSVGATRAFRLSQNDVSVDGELVLRPTDDFDAAATAIVASGVPGVYIALEPLEATRLAEALLRAGSQAVVLLAPFSSASEVFAGRFDSSAEGVVLTRPAAQLEDSEALDDWRRRYTERFNLTLQEDDLAPLVYDGVAALLAAIAAVDATSVDGTLRIARYGLYAELRDGRSAGVAGTLAFNEAGDRDWPIQVDFLQVVGPDLVVIE